MNTLVLDHTPHTMGEKEDWEATVSNERFRFHCFDPMNRQNAIQK